MMALDKKIKESHKLIKFILRGSLMSFPNLMVICPVVSCLDTLFKAKNVNAVVALE